MLIRDGRHVDDSLAPIWAKLNDEGLAGMTLLGRHLSRPASSATGSATARYATCCGTTSPSIAMSA
jgi:hypothetical protein